MQRFIVAARRLSPFILMLLVVEFLDEFAGGAREASWPVIRSDLNLTYEQIGLLLTLPSLLANILFEPILGILGDVWKRRVLILGGGVFFAASTLLIAASQSSVALLLAFILFYPASGAFVSLSQSTLMILNQRATSKTWHAGHLPDHWASFLERWWSVDLSI